MRKKLFVMLRSSHYRECTVHAGMNLTVIVQ